MSNEPTKTVAVNGDIGAGHDKSRAEQVSKGSKEATSATEQKNIEPDKNSHQQERQVPVTLASSLSAQASPSSRLKALLNVFSGDDRVLIIISADPDAIASAVALKRILWRRVSQVVVATTNQVKRPDNLQLIQTLKLKLEPLDSINISEFSRLVNLDSQPGHSPQTSFLRFNVVIDHHPNTIIDRDLLPEYIDIRPELGAAATMMVAYLKSADIKPNPLLATALFYAIKTDTQNFVRQGQLEDMRAFRWLYPLIHPQTLSNIEKAPLARSSFRRFLAGLNDAVFSKNAAYTFVNDVDHSDTLVVLADFLMQISGINRAVVAGIYGDKLVVIFRAGGLRQDVGKLASTAFSELGSAGGHKNMARAEIPVEKIDAKIRNNPLSISRFVQRKIVEAAKKLLHHG